MQRLSFVVPAKNEGRRIRRTVETILRVLPAGYGREVIVVDNGSTDDTPVVASAAGATVHERPGVTIGSARNYGAMRSSGDLLIFLDADVLVTDAWARRLPAVVDQLQACPRSLAGSVCAVPEDASWIERWWYAPQVRGGHTHIGSAHLITSRSFFEELGGFDESLQTGEDYELSRRALRMGGQLIEDTALVAIHEGNPRTLRSFVRREIWHGAGDRNGLTAIFRSKVAVAAMVFVLLHMAGLGAIVLRCFGAAGAAVVAILLLCAAASYRAYRASGAGIVLVNTYLYYWYFMGRALALLRGPFRQNTFVHRDHR